MSLEPLLVPDIAWVEIPGGPFIDQANQMLDLAPFRIAKYPLTNCQYQTFIDAGGYEDERWWKDLVKPEPEASLWLQSNRPKTNVNWYEAVAFCRWLSSRLGNEIRMPTEQEWERAARGEKALVYPWGDEYRSGFANVDEKSSHSGPWYLEQTVAVGLYPHGQSLYGVEDLSGNVWEWCWNKFDQPEVSSADSNGDRRVLRGGSWVCDRGFARSTVRGGDGPSGRGDGIGFRVLSSPRIFPPLPSAGPIDHGLRDATGKET
ncbi:MAG: formylglycine-generating enzyme family protein [Methylococcales bacterium]